MMWLYRASSQVGGGGWSARQLLGSGTHYMISTATLEKPCCTLLLSLHANKYPCRGHVFNHDPRDNAWWRFDKFHFNGPCVVRVLRAGDNDACERLRVITLSLVFVSVLTFCHSGAICTS